MSLSVPTTPIDAMSSDPVNAFRPSSSDFQQFASSCLNFSDSLTRVPSSSVSSSAGHSGAILGDEPQQHDYEDPPVTLLSMTPPPPTSTQHSSSSAVHSSSSAMHMQDSDDQTRKIPRVVMALAVPEHKTKTSKRKTPSSAASSSSSSSVAVSSHATGLDPQLLCKGGCGRPPVPSVLCVNCQSAMCMACAVASTQCPVAASHLHIRVDYVSDLLRHVAGSDSKQVDAWVMASIQDTVTWLEREKGVKTWFNPQWNGSTQERVELLLRICKVASIPEAERLPAKYLALGNSSCVVLRTVSEPAIVEMPGAVVIVAATFPGQGCFSLNQIPSASSSSSS